jgi:hypothetical protein
MFDPEYGGRKLLRNVDKLLPKYAVSHPRIKYSSLWLIMTRRDIEGAEIAQIKRL